MIKPKLKRFKGIVRVARYFDVQIRAYDENDAEEKIENMEAEDIETLAECLETYITVINIPEVVEKGD